MLFATRSRTTTNRGIEQAPSVHILRTLQTLVRQTTHYLLFGFFLQLPVPGPAAGFATLGRAGDRVVSRAPARAGGAAAGRAPADVGGAHFGKLTHF